MLLRAPPQSRLPSRKPKRYHTRVITQLRDRRVPYRLLDLFDGAPWCKRNGARTLVYAEVAIYR